MSKEKPVVKIGKKQYHEQVIEHTDKNGEGTIELRYSKPSRGISMSVPDLPWLRKKKKKQRKGARRK